MIAARCKPAGLDAALQRLDTSRLAGAVGQALNAQLNAAVTALRAGRLPDAKRAAMITANVTEASAFPVRAVIASQGAVPSPQQTPDKEAAVGGLTAKPQALSPSDLRDGIDAAEPAIRAAIATAFTETLSP